MHIRVILQIEDDDQDRTGPLTDDRGQGRASDAHGGQTEPAEDQDRVQDDVHDGADALGDHGMEGTAGGLKESLAQDLNEDTKAKDAANRSIDDAALHGLSHIGLHLEIGTGTENAEKQEHHGSDQHQQDAVAGGAVRGLLIPFAQAFAEQRVDTDTDTHGKADLQVLHRERQGKGRDGALRDPGHIDAVHHVIERLDQHGYHHRQCHIHQQFADRHDAHLILFQSILFHWDLRASCARL